MTITIAEIENKVAADLPEKKYIKSPMFFSVEANGITSYLLLTNHVIALSELPLQCHEIIHSCESYVTEQSVEDAEEYYTKAIMRSSSTESWVDKVPEGIIKFLEAAINKFYDPYEAPKLDSLEIWAAYQLAMQGHVRMLSHDSEKPETIIGNDFASDDAKEELTDGPLGMDDELMLNVFTKFNGLETLMSKIPTYKREVSTVEDLIASFHNPCQESKEISESLRLSEDIPYCLDSYRHADHLYNPTYAIDENNLQARIIQHQRWMLNFYRHHHGLKSPILFGMGSRHGVGEWGFLNLLPILGFKLKRLTPNRTFEDYTYPFHSKVISALTLSQERLTKSWTREINSGILFAFDAHAKAKKTKTEKLICLSRKSKVK